jgi:hypothetical protein
VSLRKETLKNRKEDFRWKVLKDREKKQSKRREVRKQQGCCVSPAEHPAHLIPTFCMSVFYRLSFLHFQSPPVRSGRTRAHEESFQEMSCVEDQCVIRWTVVPGPRLNNWVTLGSHPSSLSLGFLPCEMWAWTLVLMNEQQYVPLYDLRMCVLIWTSKCIIVLQFYILKK